MTRIQSLIIEKYPILKPTEKKVAKYVLNNLDNIVLLSIKKLAELCKTSDNSVLRLCRQCGFSGYQDFKSTLVKDLLTHGDGLKEFSNKNNTNFDLTKQNLLSNLYSSIEKSYQLINEDVIKKCALKILKSRQTIIIGLAGSSGVGYIFSDELYLFGVRSHVVIDRIQIERTCMSLTESDVCIGITNTGETPEVIDNLRKAHDNKCFTVAMSNNKEILTYDFIDVTLFTQVPFQNITGPYFGASRVAQIAILELILRELGKIIKSKEKKTRSTK